MGHGYARGWIDFSTDAAPLPEVLLGYSDVIFKGEWIEVMEKRRQTFIAVANTDGIYANDYIIEISQLWNWRVLYSGVLCAVKYDEWVLRSSRVCGTSHGAVVHVVCALA
ncbi:hypothetical protein ACN47E_002259 [Coniothyrium glycines]